MIKLLTALAFLMFCGTTLASETRGDWTAAWAAAPDSEGPAFENQVLRQIVRVGIAGQGVRVHLSNRYGSKPLHIGAASVALHGEAAAIEPGSTRVLQFHGMGDVVIPKGAEAVSDPVALPLAALQELAITLSLPGNTGPSTQHGVGNATAYLAARTDGLDAVQFEHDEVTSSRFYVTGVDVQARVPTQVLVAFGDSITDGVGSSQDANKRWPDALAERFQSDPQTANLVVLNAGIAGNRVLHDGVAPFIGNAAVKRFGHDALDVPGVRWVLLLDGTNDIAASAILTAPHEHVSAEQVIAGLKGMVMRAHQRGVKVMGGTLLPWGGAEWPFHSAAGERKRRQVNDWIVHGGAFDAVTDFEAALRDPAHPDRMAPAFDSGDHIHPNDAGHKAMADAIDLRLLR